MPRGFADSDWSLPMPVAAREIERLRREFALPRVTAELLLRRGWSDPDALHRFLDVSLDDVHDGGELPDLDAAAQRLALAIDRRERIVVHGDYDADGISGAALLTGVLRKLGALAEPFVPDRQIDGYGVATRLVEHAGQAQVKVLVTVDTGSSAHQQLERAAELGMDVIVCDHHLFDHRPAGARYFLNPHRRDSSYANRDLCGCAVAYKLVEGLARAGGGRFDPTEELDLVAIGLLGDQMPLEGENRALVRHGLALMSHRPRPGVAALLEVAKLMGQRIDAEDVAYQLAPRINAAGRIEKARTALQLLLSESLPQARPLAWQLDRLNAERKVLDQQVTDDATRRAAQTQADQPVAGLVLASDAWHLGVVGIGAARVAEEFDVPTVLLAIDGEEARGSARSVPGFDLKAALDLCRAHLTRYGGHAAAAGMTLPTTAIAAFRDSFARAAAELPRGGPSGALQLDAELTLAEIDENLAESLQRLGPFGPGNPTPLFASFAVTKVSGPQVVGDNHLRFEAGQPGVRRPFIGFGMAQEFLERLVHWPRLDLAYRIKYREGSRFDPWQLTLAALRGARDEKAQAG